MVAVAPRIVMPNRRIGQSFGRETILECTITASPQAVSYWQKDGRRISNSVNVASSTSSSAGSGRVAEAIRSSASTFFGYSGAVPLPPPSAGSMTYLQQKSKYHIEPYDENDHTLTLSLRFLVSPCVR
jgi:hypothetical protein